LDHVASNVHQALDSGRTEETRGITQGDGRAFLMFPVTSQDAT